MAPKRGQKAGLARIRRKIRMKIAPRRLAPKLIIGAKRLIILQKGFVLAWAFRALGESLEPIFQVQGQSFL
jgi:hypothetical protein